MRREPGRGTSATGRGGQARGGGAREVRGGQRAAAASAARVPHALLAGPPAIRRRSKMPDRERLGARRPAAPPPHGLRPKERARPGPQ